MTQDYVEYTLGPPAVSYIRERLQDGKTLSKCLLSALNLESGRVTIHLPSDATADNMEEFTWGGKLPEAPQELHVRVEGGGLAIPVANTDPYLVASCVAFLRERPRRICLFEEWMVSASKPWKGSPRFLNLGEDVYYFAVSGEPDIEQRLKDAIRSARQVWPPTLGVLSELPDGLQLAENSGQVTESELRQIAQEACQLIVGAYDAEACLIWTRV